jgi:hypothetical protein
MSDAEVQGRHCPSPEPDGDDVSTCGECGGDLNLLGVRALHFVMQGGTVVCGATASVTSLVETDTEQRLRSAEVRLAAISMLHRCVPDVLIDTIHRGMTPIYGEGCEVCREVWPCDTVKILTEGS